MLTYHTISFYIAPYLDYEQYHSDITCSASNILTSFNWISSVLLLFLILSGWGCDVPFSLPQINEVLEQEREKLRAFFFI